MKIVRPSQAAAKALLSAYALPTVDLMPEHFAHFFAVGSFEAPVALAGIEPFDRVGLVRSVVVKEEVRKQGLGSHLVTVVEDYARQLGIVEVYLLTDSSQTFFSRLGYETSARSTAPIEISTTKEFASLCASSATLMRKAL